MVEIKLTSKQFSSLRAIMCYAQSNAPTIADVSQEDVNNLSYVVNVCAQASVAVLEFSDLMRMWPGVVNWQSNEGDEIAEAFNQNCDMGLEVKYVEDSMWEFVDEDAADAAIEASRLQDAKRMSD